MGTVNYFQAIKPDTAYIKKIINSSLLFDWTISIEYQEPEAGPGNWRLWESAFFAVRSADSVIESLMKCYGNNPGCAMRINAEKLRPRSQLLYTVYDPGYVPEETESKVQASRAWPSLKQGIAIDRSGLIS